MGRSALKAGRRWLESIALRAFFFAMEEMFFEVWMLSAWGGGNRGVIESGGRLTGVRNRA